MASTNPTILAIDGVIRTVVESSIGGTCVTPGSSFELARAVLKYYKNPSLKKLHGLNAKGYVKKYFERKKLAGELEKVFLSLHAETGALRAEKYHDIIK
jgi:glycosyltransferase involved in cell wall biosynthesis